MADLVMNPYCLALNRPDDLVEEFKKIGVHWGGVPIMLAKGFSRVVKIRLIPTFLANILKQEMLSLGGDVALSRGSITGTDKATDCLIMGNESQILQLTIKLKKQPFGLSKIADSIKIALANFGAKGYILNLKGKRLHLGKRTLLMGIVNATPDSFSGDGVFGIELDKAVRLVQDMVDNGADLLDIGGESSRPGAKRISVKEEKKRIVPLLKQLAKKIKVPISVDTMKSEVAHAALDLGVSVVNDISALRFDKKMARLIARYKACVVLMHMKGIPKTMQKNPQYQDVVSEVISFLTEAIQRAKEAGISEDRIIIDPGIGFGKSLKHNIEILQRLAQLKSLGRPILVGLSRKRFIGKILNADVHKRIWGTAGAMAMAISHGADILRVHDVKEMKHVALVSDAIVR